MKSYTCKSCGYTSQITPKGGSWVCPKCGKKVLFRKKRDKEISKVKKDPEIEELLKPLDRTKMPPPREKLFLFYKNKKK